MSLPDCVAKMSELGRRKVVRPTEREQSTNASEQQCDWCSVTTAEAAELWQA